MKKKHPTPAQCCCKTNPTNTSKYVLSINYIPCAIVVHTVKSRSVTQDLCVC